MSSSTEFRVYRGTEELEQIAGDWSSLWLADEIATPFQSPEWLLSWWRHFSDGELRVVAIWDGEELIGLLPFYSYRESPDSDSKALLLGAGTTDYLDGVFAPQCTPNHVRSAFMVLRGESGWDQLHLAQLRSTSRLFQAMQGQAGACRPSEACLRFPAARLAELPPKFRGNARYYQNRARRQGELSLGMADESNCLNWFEVLCRLHTERWRQRGEPGVLADERVLAWHREAIPMLQRAGVLRLYALNLGGEMIAMLYSLVDHLSRSKRTQYMYLPAYSVRHADLRPGTVLQALAVDDAAQEGIETIDLLRGNERYKQLWHSSIEPTWSVFISRASMSGGEGERRAEAA